ncbi:hypothetical protein [Arthrobacter echini]|nr:hypothetical protein [Arthrobacter echini]
MAAQCAGMMVRVKESIPLSREQGESGTADINEVQSNGDRFEKGTIIS